MSDQGMQVRVKDATTMEGFYNISFDVLSNGEVRQSAMVMANDDIAILPMAILQLDKALQVPGQNGQQNAAQTGNGLPKSSKPKVELFVMSYCPYGTQIEKGIIPALKALGDKADFELKFVNYAMHGEKEVNENLEQYCIQKEFPGNFIDYLSCFLEAGDSSGCLETVGISESDLTPCKTATDDQYNITKLLNDQPSYRGGHYPQFNIHDAENQAYGVRGSPTLVVNWVKASSARDAQSLLKTICSAFSQEPAECSTDLSSEGVPSPGFGYKQGSASSAGGCGN